MSAFLLGMIAACGSNAIDDDAPIPEGEAKRAVEEFMLTSLGLLTGQSTPQDYIGLFAPRCRTEVDDATVATSMALIQSFGAELQGLRVEEVDVGKIVLEPTDTGTLVSLTDVDNLRLKVNGQSVLAHEWLAGFGFSPSGNELAESLLLVRWDGELYLGDCTHLDVFSSYAR